MNTSLEKCKHKNTEQKVREAICEISLLYFRAGYQGYGPLYEIAGMLVQSRKKDDKRLRFYTDCAELQVKKDKYWHFKSRIEYKETGESDE